MADDGYVTILRTIDTAQGELIAEMFRREGIAARFHQIRSTLIGMVGLPGCRFRAAASRNDQGRRLVQFRARGKSRSRQQPSEPSTGFRTSRDGLARAKPALPHANLQA